jgi:hypothetical protein
VVALLLLREPMRKRQRWRRDQRLGQNLHEHREFKRAGHFEPSSLALTRPPGARFCVLSDALGTAHVWQMRPDTCPASRPNEGPGQLVDVGLAHRVRREEIHQTLTKTHAGLV